MMLRFVILMTVVSGFASGGATAEDATSTIYDPDPQHLWNRLHTALMVRVGPNGIAYGHDRLEPMLWPQTKHLLEPASHQRLIAVLQEFDESDGEDLIREPLKRALLQRDVWLVFNWVQNEHRSFANPRLDPDEVREATDRLSHRLSNVIDRVALTSAEIQTLPDNLRAAVASDEFSDSFDASEPSRAYLPAGMFDADGDWVSVGRSDGITAPQHLRGENPFTNSVFFVMLRFPAGREATLHYLDRLFRFDQPLLIANPRQSDRRAFPFLPNREVPQVPSGTEYMLVRRAMLIDSSHRVHVSPLTESVQLRTVFGDVESLEDQLWEDPSAYSRQVRRRVDPWQAFHEFQLRRSKLLAMRSGGLHAVAPDERDFKTGFNSHTWDEFEHPRRPDQDFLTMAQPVATTQRCSACHSLPGVYSFNSFKMDFRFAMGRENGDQGESHPLAIMDSSEVARAALQWKRNEPRWLELKSRLGRSGAARVKN